MSNGFAETFIEEGREQLTEIENHLISIEDDPDDEEALNQVFRSAHTLKGNAGAMGYTDFADLAHVLEDVLDDIRSDDLEVDTEVMDSLFDASDAMWDMLDEIEEHGESEYDPQEEVAALKEVIGEDIEEGDVEQCAALTKDGSRCPRDVDEDRYCWQHLNIIEEDGKDAVTDYDEETSAEDEGDVEDGSDEEDDGEETVEDGESDTEHEPDSDVQVDIDIEDADELLEGLSAPEEPVPNAYYLTVEIDGDNTDTVEAINDAFVVLATSPSMETLRESHDGSFAAIIAGNIDTEAEATAWFEGMDSVSAIDAEDLSNEVEWVEETEDDAGEMDDVEIDSLDDLDNLIGVDEFDDVDEVDEDMVDDVDLGMDEVGESGVFHDAEVENPVIDDEEEEDDDLPDNRGARIFDELSDEVDEADSFDEIEAEMEEMGFGEEFDEMDSDEEVGFDELLEANPDEFAFDEDDESAFDGAAAEETPGLFDDMGDDEEEESAEEPDVTAEIDEADEATAEIDDGDEDVDLDTGIDLGEDVEEDTGLLDEEAEADADDPFADDDPFEDISSETDTEEESVEGDIDTEGVEDEAAAAAEVDDLVGDEFDDVGGQSPDLFGSEFDDDSDDVDFDDLLRDAGRDVDVSDDSGDTIDSIRVDVDELDEMYSLVQELVTSRIRLRRAIATDAEGDSLSQAFDELDTLDMITSRMQDTVMDIRLVKLGRITDRLPRVVRDTARENDKEVDFDIEGEDVELDRAILERLGDPLMHIVRNAVDHGIEDPDTREARGKSPEGELRIKARRTRDRVTIKVSDDGGGINPAEVRQKAIEEDILSEDIARQLDDEQAVELIFHPGFSTTDEVSETSGRGVGLDVVYTTIRSLDGSVDVDSTPGEGTTITLRLPVSLAIDEVLLIEAGGEEYGIPIKNISEITGVQSIQEVNNRRAHIHNGDVYPIVQLDDALGTPDSLGDEGRLIRVDDDVRQIAIQCDAVVESTEVVVEPYDGVLRTVPGLSGAAVLGEGDVVNILDVERL